MMRANQRRMMAEKIVRCSLYMRCQTVFLW